MSNTLRIMGLSALFALTASALMPGQASALSMTECSAKYKAAKAADPNTPAWNDFRKAQCGADATAAAPAAAPAPAPAAKTKPATAATAVATTPTPSGSFMQNCSASWKAMKAAGTTPAGMDWKAYLAAKCPAPAAAPATTATKTSAKTTTTAAAPAATAPKMSMADCSAAWKAAKAANTVPAGMTWNQFRSAGCTVAGAPAAGGAAAAATTTLAPPEPADTPDNTPLATADKNGKAYTPGQLAAHKRIKQCGVMWQQAKAANKLPAAIMALDTKHRWPQYWSDCNKQLKAKGM